MRRSTPRGRLAAAFLHQFPVNVVNAVDRSADYAAEPMTLVEFRLEETEQGTLLMISESGFDSIALERRAKAFTSNDGGWAHQLRLVEKYLDRPSL